MKKKILLVVFLIIAAFAVWAGASKDTAVSGGGSKFPNRQIEIIVPYAAGGGTDIFVRQICTALYKVLGVPVIANNQTGAAGLRAVGLAMKARPDGYTLIAFNPPSAPLAQMLQNPGFDMRDLTPIVHYATDAVMLVTHPSLPYNTYPELAEAYKTGKISTMGGGLVGSLDEVGVRLLKKNAGLEFQQQIGYSGSGDTVSAVLRQEVDVGGVVAGSALNLIKDGDLKPVMVLTSKRFPALPDVPCLGEYGYDSIDAVVQSNRIICAPPNLPEDIRKTLEAAILQALKDPELVKWAEGQGLPVVYGDSQDARETLLSAFDIPKFIDLRELSM
jgi:tripartite-type tricarboxylate transporter receptor subunit TctC